MSTHSQASSSVLPRTMEPLLSIAQAAGFLGVSRWQIYRLIERGELPAVRVGGRLRFVPEELREYLERNRIREPAP